MRTLRSLASHTVVQTFLTGMSLTAWKLPPACMETDARDEPTAESGAWKAAVPATGARKEGALT